LVKTTGKVKTAGGNTHDITGIGSIQVQKLHLKPVYHVPDFTHNLVSGPQLMKSGYDINLKAKDLSFTVTKDSECVANGKLQLNNDLLVLSDDSKPPSKNIARLSQKLSNKNMLKLYTKLHYDFGHNSNHTIYKTLKLETPPPPNVDCNICNTTKLNHNSTTTPSKTKYQLLDTLEIDLQITNVQNRDGLSINIKAVDLGSGFLLMKALKSIGADETNAFIKKYIPLLERHANSKIKNIRTDNGTEFAGEFKKTLNNLGIIHQIGVGYEHHFPPRVERSNQTIF
jgi:hypothetical protein